MQDKVKLTKAQAESLEDASKYNDIEKIVRIHMDVPDAKAWMRGSVHLNELSLDTLIRALYIGYEVEKTEEEQLFEAYEECPVVNGGRWAQSENIAAFRDGMTTALNIVGKRIWGINE